MLRTIPIYLLTAALLLSAGVSDAADTSRNLTPREASVLLQRDAGQVTLIDARTPGEFFRERIAGGKLLRTDLPARDVYANIYALPTDQAYIVYCTIGSRSSQVAAIMSQSGQFGTVYNLAGGIEAWKHAGLPVLQGPP